MELIVQWVCEICGYRHDDDDRPGSCPVCGGPSNKFTKFFEGDDQSEEPDEDEGVDNFAKDLFADYEDESI
jgi:hypothetical protein